VVIAVVPVVFLVLTWRDVVTPTLPVVLVAVVMVLVVSPSRPGVVPITGLGIVPIVSRLWVGHGWSVVCDQMVGGVAVPPKVVIDHAAVRVVVVVITAAITPVGTRVAAVSKRLGDFEVIARTIETHLGESNPKMGTTYIEGPAK
jgi:hypothetical protein